MVEIQRKQKQQWRIISAHLLVGVLSLIFILSASAQEKGVGVLIKYRQNFMDTKNQLNYGISLLTRTIKMGDEERNDQIVTHAEALAGMAQNILHLFPYGSTSDVSRALPGIWDAKGKISSDFTQAAIKMMENAQALAAAAKKGDVNEVKKKSRALNLSCKNCHSEFRQSYGLNK